MARVRSGLHGPDAGLAGAFAQNHLGDAGAAPDGDKEVIYVENQAVGHGRSWIGANRMGATQRTAGAVAGGR
jgi:hypothetical protein